MNIPVFIVGVLTSLAFVAHLVVGTQESYSLKPTASSDAAFRVAERNWLQSMAAFQMVTVDLLALSILLFVLALTDLISAESTIILTLSAFYLLWGVAWVVQLVMLKAQHKNYLQLGQWLLWLLCAALLYWGA